MIIITLVRKVTWGLGGGAESSSEDRQTISSSFTIPDPDLAILAATLLIL